MTTGIIALLLLAFAVSSGVCATDVSIEGQWRVNGINQLSKDTTCTLKFYGSSDGSAVLWTTNGCRLATDSSGYFVVGATVADGVSLPDTFWVGVTPAGSAEIEPRFRVAPVPFAIAAEEVELVKNDSRLELSGEATIGRLETSGDVAVGDWMLPPNGQVNVRNLQLDSARLASVSLASNGRLGLFNDRASTSSCDYDTIAADASSYAEAQIKESGFFLTHDESVTNEVEASHTFSGDGFLLLAIKADPKECPASQLAVRVGGTAIYDGAIGSDKGGVVKRLMTVPYRSGEEVKLKLTAAGGGTIPFREQSSYKSNIGVKLHLVKFGRN